MNTAESGIDYAWRRQTVFLALSGLFLGTLAFLNVVGISRFLDLSFDVFGMTVPLAIAVGVLPYPITFMCTDLISELFGEKKAREMVWIGLLLNLWVLLILWVGTSMPGFEVIDPQTGLPELDEAGRLPVFFEVKHLAFGAVAASMIAYLLAQLCDFQACRYWDDEGYLPRSYIHRNSHVLYLSRFYRYGDASGTRTRRIYGFDKGNELVWPISGPWRNC